MREALGKGHRVIDGVDDDNLAEQAPQDARVGLVASANPTRKADHTRLCVQVALLQLAALNGAHRQESRSTDVVFLQQQDGLFCCLLVVHDQILHRGAKGGLDGHSVLGGHLNESRNRPMHAAQGLLADFLHDELHAVRKAVQISLELLKQTHLALLGLRIEAQLVDVLPQLPALFLVGLHFALRGRQPYYQRLRPFAQ